MDTTHPQVEIECNGRQAEVDEAITGLIETLWKLDIDTMMSCQNNNGQIWICFAYSLDAQKFLEVCVTPKPREGDDPTLVDRILGDNDDGDGWKYDTFPLDWSEDDDIYIPLAISIRFPRKDYDEVLGRCLAYWATSEEEIKSPY